MEKESLLQDIKKSVKKKMKNVEIDLDK